MGPVEQYLQQRLQERKQAGNLRQLTTQHAGVDFFSNDYLGFATNSLLEVSGYASGSTGSRLLSGNSADAMELEQKIAAFHCAEAALLFNSGYDANIGLLTSIADRHTTYIYDELCHASIIDGIRLSMAGSHFKCRHNDIDDLQQKLSRVNSKAVVVVESVYSMDGDIAPLKEICAVAEKHQASVIVDEAHATGVFGSTGEGVVCDRQLQDKVLARVHTYGKALGCHGAAVIGNETLKQYLVNFARSFIYTTALPPHSIALIDAAYTHLASPSFTNKPLHDLITYFRNKISNSGINGWKDSISPIQVLIVGGNEPTKRVAAALQHAGLQVNPILHPTVPQGMERLRITLHSFNTPAQADLLFDVLKNTICIPG